jgi:hypothetical protein
VKTHLIAAAGVFVFLAILSGLPAAGLDSISAVFVIMMENHNWSSIKGSADAPKSGPTPNIF